MYLDHILKSLVKGVEVHSKAPPQLGHLDVVDIEDDSRQVKPEFLFIARQGISQNGEKYIVDAIKNGATVVLASKATCLELRDQFPSIIFLSHPHIQDVFYQLIELFYPKKPAHLVAVTGTNGKTSTVEFIRQIWKILGYAGASIGSLGVITNNSSEYKKLTTLNALELARELQKLALKGVSHVAMEASSHGLHQGRLRNLIFQVVGFTNLSQEHLDYHESLSDYLEAKLLLFRKHMSHKATAIVNADTKFFNAVKAAVGDHPIITYGKASQDITLNYIQPLAVGQKISITVFGKLFRLDFPLIGRFQVINALGALGFILAINPERTEEAINALSKLEGVPSRLEFIGTTKKGANVYVDFAHKPEALKTVLETLKPHTENELFVVFGCGGNRDKGKRPQMGKIAAELADRVIVTDDNPRHEDPGTIRSEVIAGCPNAKNIGDRRKAIAEAMEIAGKGDSILIAGKGHETGQIIGDEVLPFDDREIVREILRS